MANIKSFTDIKAWQKAHELVLLIYKLTKAYPKCEDYCLTNQIRRAAISIASNIAEGFKRRSVKDSVHFYNIADSSLEEVKYQLILSKDLKYITDVKFADAYNLAEEVGRLLCGWHKSQQ